MMFIIRDEFLAQTKGLTFCSVLFCYYFVLFCSLEEWPLELRGTIGQMQQITRLWLVLPTPRGGQNNS